MVEIIGRKEETKPGEVIVERADGFYAYPNKIEAFQTNAEISSRDYALVQEGNEARYAMSMKQRFNGSHFVLANLRVLQSDLFVPTPAIFMPHYKNVNDVQQGRGVLYDSSGNLIEGKRLDSYAKRLNHNCEVWLNASFRKGTGFLGLDLLIIKGLDKEGNPVMENMPLEHCLKEQCYADLESLNSQGLPRRKSETQDFRAGKNFCFWPPSEGGAVRFDAGSVVAILNCDIHPGYLVPSLGVFPCVEGVSQKISKI